MRYTRDGGCVRFAKSAIKRIAYGERRDGGIRLMCFIADGVISCCIRQSADIRVANLFKDSKMPGRLPLWDIKYPY